LPGSALNEQGGGASLNWQADKIASFKFFIQNTKSILFYQGFMILTSQTKYKRAIARSFAHALKLNLTLCPFRPQPIG